MDYIAAFMIALVIWLAIREIRLTIDHVLHYLYAQRKNR